jgi:lipid A disaccharide synthetase
MISCGEPSGDLYAGALATEILRQYPGAVITGFGGAHLEAAGAVLIDHFSGLSVTGLRRGGAAAASHLRDVSPHRA